jgi:hypothetical protein
VPDEDDDDMQLWSFWKFGRRQTRKNKQTDQLILISFLKSMCATTIRVTRTSAGNKEEKNSEKCVVVMIYLLKHSNNDKKKRWMCAIGLVLLVQGIWINFVVQRIVGLIWYLFDAAVICLPQSQFGCGHLLFFTVDKCTLSPSR